MVKNILRLQFENVFPDEEPKELLEYLKEMSSFMLLNTIGFSTTEHGNNFDTIFSNPDIRTDVIDRVIKYSKENDIKDKPELFSKEGTLRLSEIILSKKTTLLENNNNDDRDVDELSFLKALLIMNKDVNYKEKYMSSDDEFERLVDFGITITFSHSDLGIYNNEDFEYRKLMYCTLERMDYLLKFLQSKNEYKFLLDGLTNYFNVENVQKLRVQTKYLFAKMLELKMNNAYRWKVEEPESKLFLNSLVSTEDDEIVPDFTIIRNNPLYVIEEDVYSIVNPFMVMDKFSKSLKFVLKNIYNDHHGITNPKDGRFLQFYTKDYTEEFLVKNILDQIFDKPYFIKRNSDSTIQNEPDYYVRHNKRIYLFEVKDIMVRGDIKISGNIDKINDTLKKKFLHDGNRDVGVGQLVNHIVKIIEQNFDFDEFVNENKNFKIYPILLVSDRIFEVLGINYRLNNWFIELVKERLGDKYNSSLIRNLTFIDIDTLIYWLPFFKLRDNNFRDVLDDHSRKMNTNRRTFHPNPVKAKEIASRNLSIRLSPISNRNIGQEPPIKLLIEKFREIVNDDLTD